MGQMLVFSSRITKIRAGRNLKKALLRATLGTELGEDLKYTWWSPKHQQINESRVWEIVQRLVNTFDIESRV